MDSIKGVTKMKDKVDITKPKVTFGSDHMEYIYWALNVLQHDKRFLTEEEWDDAMTCMKWIEDDLNNETFWGEDEV